MSTDEGEGQTRNYQKSYNLPMTINFKPESNMRLEKNTKKSVQFILDRRFLQTTSPGETDDSSYVDIRRIKSQFIPKNLSAYKTV